MVLDAWRLDILALGTATPGIGLRVNFNPRTDGGLSHLRTTGRGADDRPPPPENSKTKKDSDKR